MKFRHKILATTLAFTLTFGAGVVSADEIDQLIKVTLNKVNVEINGVKMESDNILYNGRTYVQLKEVSEALGKDLTWDGSTFTANIVDKNIKDINKEEINTQANLPNGYEILETVNAKFVGQTPHKNGEKWYKADSKYTEVYFFNDAVDMEWIMEDIDAQFEYLLEFRKLTWDGYKLPIYFYSEDVKLSSESGYHGSAYTLDKKFISMSADHQYVTMDYQYSDGRRIEFKEDPRHTLLHEMAHHLNHPKKLKTTDKWLEEGLAYYLAYNYDFKDVDTKVYPDYKKRKFSDFVFTNSKVYSKENWLNYLENEEFERFTKEGISNLLTFEKIAKSHYGMVDEDTPAVKYIEPIVIEYMIDTYGRDKLIELYANVKLYDKYFDMHAEIKKVYEKDISELEAEFREYINFEKYYIKE